VAAPRVRVEVHSFPSTDARFRATVARTMERYSPLDPTVLAAFLRPIYPAVEVVERDDLATLDIGGPAVWYAFRDGEGVPDDGEI
jgi:hypothetical protein